MAIKGSEDLTHELTEAEKLLVPVLTAKLSECLGKKQALTNAKLRAFLFSKTGQQVVEVRLRKMIETIRQRQPDLRIVAQRFGYFIANNPDEYKDWLETMKQRRNALSNTISSGEKTLRAWVGYKQPNQHKRPKLDTTKVQSTLL